MPPEICLLLLGLLGAARGLITGDEGPPGFSPLKTPVYFPIFPEDFKDFGLRLGGDVPGEGRGKSLDMPTTTPKPTTTTDKLPINPDGLLSHVALEAVTQPPGPSYLTDSYYYLDDHTAKPGSAEDSGEGHGHSHPVPDRESEKQHLQNLAPISSTSLGNDPLSPLALIGVPAVSVTQAPTVPAPETTRAPAKYTRRPSRPSRTRRPSLPSPSPSPLQHEENIRPAFTPIPTPPPTIAPEQVPTTILPTTPRTPTSYAPSRSPSRSSSRPYSSSRPSSRISSRPPSRTSSRPASIEKSKTSTSEPRRVSKTRVGSRRPSFESSRISPLATTTTTTTTTTTRPTRPPSSYQTPTPLSQPSTTTTSRRRGYQGRITSSSAPRRVTERQRPRKEEAPVYRTSTKSYRAPSSLYHVRGTTTTVTAPAQPDFVQSDPNIYVPVEYDDEAIPGVAGIDYPVYSAVPETQFRCEAQEHPGLYADTEAQCQIFHICQEDGRHDSFLCPNGTVFNQQYFVCDWWYNFSCDHAARFYSLNALIYEIPDADKYSKK